MNANANAITKTPAIDATIQLDTPAIGMSPNDTLQLTFANGERISLRVGDLHPSIVAQAVMHGLKQKLVDAAAISRNTDTGRAASIDDKYAAVKEVYDRLLAGEWNKRREGAGTGAGGLLFRALCRMYAGKKSADDIKAFLEAKTDAEKAALRKNARVAAIIEEIRAESVRPGDVDSDDILAGLGD